VLYLLSSIQNRDGSYTGFVKVQFKLARPVSVPPPKKGSAAQEAARGKRASGVKRRTSFYLPKDTSKHLHIGSHTSAREVIAALLKKFTVVDNPAKFALFERRERHEQGMHLLFMYSTLKPQSTWSGQTPSTSLVYCFKMEATEKIQPC